MCEVQAVDKVTALIAGASSLLADRCGELSDWLDSLADNFAYLNEREQLEHILCGLFDSDILAGVFKID